MSISRTIYTVTKLNETVNKFLKKKIGKIWLIGEISNFSKISSSGHWFFTLKDIYSQVKVTMFKYINYQIDFIPKDGQNVLIYAKISLYEKKGDFQLIAENIKLTGKGLLHHKYEKLKNKLYKEGLFNVENKKYIPKFAKCVGIVTSIDGSALYDILQILKRRDPLMSVIIYPTQVQGEEASKMIAKSIEIANSRSECDVLIVGRGGGSLEDLFCFNDEQVVRAIYASHIPIISAIGHETDITISDYVSDLRASTPSSAAELVSQNRFELIKSITKKKDKLKKSIYFFIFQNTQKINKYFYLLKYSHPLSNLVRKKNKLVLLNLQLNDNINRKFLEKFSYFNTSQKNLFSHFPEKKLNLYKKHIILFNFQLIQFMKHQLMKKKSLVSNASFRLKNMNPLNILDKGFCIVTDSKNQVIKSSKQIDVGNKIFLQLGFAKIESIITKINLKMK